MYHDITVLAEMLGISENDSTSLPCLDQKNSLCRRNMEL